MKPSRQSYSTVFVAKRLGVSVPTVQRWVDAGRLKAWKTLGGHRRVDAESADRLFRQQDEGLLVIEPDVSVTAVIVDDNPDDLDILVAMVESALPGAKVFTARNGYEGLLKIGQIQPDLVITDVSMPTMDGIEMIRQLTLHTGAKLPLVLAVSSLSADQVARRGTLPPGVHLLSKPLNHEAVRGALGRLKSVPSV